jgi:hypothetical protein
VFLLDLASLLLPASSDVPVVHVLLATLLLLLFLLLLIFLESLLWFAVDALPSSIDVHAATSVSNVSRVLPVAGVTAVVSISAVFSSLLLLAPYCCWHPCYFWRTCCS